MIMVVLTNSSLLHVFEEAETWERIVVFVGLPSMVFIGIVLIGFMIRTLYVYIKKARGEPETQSSQNEEVPETFGERLVAILNEQEEVIEQPGEGLTSVIAEQEEVIEQPREGLTSVDSEWEEVFEQPGEGLTSVDSEGEEVIEQLGEG